MKNSTVVKLVALGLFIGAFVTPVSSFVAGISVIAAAMFACTGFVCQSIEEKSDEKGI